MREEPDAEHGPGKYKHGSHNLPRTSGKELHSSQMHHQDAMMIPNAASETVTQVFKPPALCRSSSCHCRLEIFCIAFQAATRFAPWKHSSSLPRLAVPQR